MLLFLDEVDRLEQVIINRAVLTRIGKDHDDFKKFASDLQLTPAQVEKILIAAKKCLALQSALVRTALVMRYDGKKSVEVLTGLKGVSKMSFYRWRKDFLIDVLLEVSEIKKD